jgi:isopentenyldiphosphate isomerase
MNLSDEWFPVVDEDGNETGRAPRHVCHDGKSFLLHPVVHLHLLNSEGRLFLQKRSAAKDIQPGKWDTSVGGHISPGESPGEAVLREASEELGISGIRPVFLGRYVWKSAVERELVSSFLVVSDVLPVINKDEIEEGRYWDISEIEESIGKDIFTPNFEHEFAAILSGRI